MTRRPAFAAMPGPGQRSLGVLLAGLVLAASLALAWHSAHAVEAEADAAIHAAGPCDAHLAEPCGVCLASGHKRPVLGAGDAPRGALRPASLTLRVPRGPDVAPLAHARETASPRAPPAR